MLCDDIVSAVGSIFDSEKLGSPITALAEKVIDAECFVFDADVMAAAYQLSLNKPSSLLDATRFCRIPFNKIWVEWSGHIDGRDGELAEGTAVPKRFGALVECFDETGKRFGVSFCWSHEKEAAIQDIGVNVDSPYVNVSPLGMAVNWADGWSMLDAVASDNRRSLTAAHPWDKYRKDEKENQAISTLLETAFLAVPPHFNKMMLAMKERMSDSDFRKANDVFSRDLNGELALLIGAICLLNSKNCVSTEPADLDKINRSRLRKNKAPLISYSTVRIHLSKSEKRRADEAGLSKAEIRKHVVRGHFKIRKTGIYWWRPHFRGDDVYGEVRRVRSTVSQ